MKAKKTNKEADETKAALKMKAKHWKSDAALKAKLVDEKEVANLLGEILTLTSRPGVHPLNSLDNWRRMTKEELEPIAAEYRAEAERVEEVSDMAAEDKRTIHLKERERDMKHLMKGTLRNGYEKSDKFRNNSVGLMEAALDLKLKPIDELEALIAEEEKKGIEADRAKDNLYKQWTT